MAKARDFTGTDYYMRAAEVDELQRLVRLLPANPVIVNIGSGLGTSSAAILEARPDATLYSIDNQECPEEPALLKRLGLPVAQLHRIRGESQAIGLEWTEPIDAVFIDGGHLYHLCRDDFRAWSPHVKPGGLVIFHDYGAIMLPTVTNAINDLAIPWPVVGREDTLIAYEVPAE